MKWTFLVFGVVFFAASTRTWAVYNREEDKPGLQQAVVLEKGSQLVQGEIDRLNRQQALRAASVKRAGDPSIAPATTFFHNEAAAPSSAWVKWLQTATLMAGGSLVLYWMLRALIRRW